MTEQEGSENLAGQSFHLQNIQEGVLALGMYNDDMDATTDYTVDANGIKRLDRLEDRDTGMLAERFRHDPKDMLACGRENMFSIMRDGGLDRETKISRVERYLDAFLHLQLELDHLAFPPDETVRRGVPDYIPDGLTDMGGDSRINPGDRGREKIRVDKSRIFEQARQLFIKIFATENPPEMSSTELKMMIIKEVAVFVHEQMPYDYVHQNPFAGMMNNRSIMLNEAFDRRQAVCRHHALYTQVLLQAFGITSRLLKCTVDFNGRPEAHAANLIRVNSRWSLLDSTNPDGREPFIAPLPETNIDTNTMDYTWDLPRRSRPGIWRYTSRNNMYYKYTGNSLR